MLVHVHGGVGGAQETILCRTIFRIEGDADAGRTMDDISFGGERFFKAALKPKSDLSSFRAIVNRRQEHGKFVASEPGQHVDGAKLALHANRHFLQVQVSDLVAVDVVYLLKVIEVDINQSEDACVLSCLVNLLIQIVLQREPVVDVGEQVELGAVDQIGVKPPGFNGQSGQRCCRGEGLRLDGARFGERIERGIDGSERRSGACGNRFVGDAE